ncbi:MFS transporter [Candidatus Solirubrobacter pratensis]|uniref:MFS transporter n=1 Tax=Candidatus Solirubrobacter pratensis TaxID=1298857 RepID=UPI000415F79C|nr:MFS transporter [Candidatus Solirubrobacter pratensis]
MQTRVARWGAVAAYGSAAAANQLLWLTYAPVTTDAARHYGVSEATVGWLSQVFPLLYVVLAIPAGLALDRRFRGSLLLGAWLTALGGAVRLAGDTFAVAMAGQLLVAIAQPLVLNAITKLVAASLPSPSHALGISLASAGIFAGTAIALVLGPALASADDFTPLLVVDVVVAVVAAAALSLALRRVASEPGAAVAVVRHELREVWEDRLVRRVTGVAFLGFGIFVALTTWLQALLEPAGVSDAEAGWLLAAMVVAGVAGSAALPEAVARRGAELRFLRAAAIVAAAGCALLAVLPGARWVAIAPMGVMLLASLPVILELTERRAGAAAASATSLVWMAGNAGGIVVALAVQAAVDTPAVGFGLMAAVALLVLPLTR